MLSFSPQTVTPKSTMVSISRVNVDVNNVNSPSASATLGCLYNQCAPGCNSKAKIDTKDWSEESYPKQAFGTVVWEEGVAPRGCRCKKGKCL